MSPTPGRIPLAAGARALASALLLAVLAGCPSKGQTGGPDGGLPDDLCPDRDAGLNAPDCEIPLDGGFRTNYIRDNKDQDWYRIQLPASLSPRNLVEVIGGYQAPGTPVDLALNVLPVQAGQPSLANGVDLHGQAAPKPVDLVFRYTQPNTQLLVLVENGKANSSLPSYDLSSPYVLRANLLLDPDVNEPNDVTPTPVTLAAGAAYLEGTSTGALSVPDDVDKFAITIPAAAATPRKILYLHITAPLLNPPPAYLLSYTLYAPDGTAISEGHAANKYLPVDLATARVVAPGQQYTLVVQGYRDANTVGPVPGDLRLLYAVDARVMDELDTHEPNDTLATAAVASIAAPDSPALGFTGKLEHVPDFDWYAVDLPAQTNPTVLHYQLTAGTGSPRFPPLVPLPDHQVSVVTQVSSAGATQAALVQSCLTDPTVCPKGDQGSGGAQSLIQTFCNQAPPQCLQSMRIEDPVFPNLKNFEGSILVPPHSATVRYFLVVNSQGSDWADDNPYTLSVQWRSAPNEAARYSGGVKQVTVLPLTSDVPTSASFPAPPPGSTTLSGSLPYGFGRLNNFQPAQGDGIRAANDYDAIVTDIDRYEIDLPTIDPTAGPLDRTWELQWSVNHSADGGYVHDLGLDITFCDGFNLDGGQCTPVSTASDGVTPLTLQYTSTPSTGWILSPSWQPLYDRATTAASETVTARAFGCFCFEPRFVAGGKFYVNVSVSDRTRYDDVPYTVTMALTSYPQSYAQANDGGMKSCPPPTALDGGAADAGSPDGGSDAGFVYTYAPGCQFTQ